MTHHRGRHSFHASGATVLIGFLTQVSAQGVKHRVVPHSDSRMHRQVSGVSSLRARNASTRCARARISPNAVHSVTIPLGSNIGPERCWDKARQMTNVRCCNDQVGSGDIQCECLSRYQHITIQLFGSAVGMPALRA